MNNVIKKLTTSLIVAVVLTAVNTSPALAGETVVLGVEVLPETGASVLALSIGLGMLLIGLGVRRMSESK